MKELDHLIDSVNKSDYFDFPYEHFYATNVFSDKFYDQMLDEMPTDEEFSYLLHSDCMLDKEKEISARLQCALTEESVNKMTNIWKDVYEIFTSDKLKSVLMEKFKKTVRLDNCKAYPYLIRDKKHYKITPHSDIPAKIITTQMYLPRDNSHEDIGTIIYVEKKSGRFRKYKEFKFHRNTYYGFPVCYNTFHGCDIVEYDNYDRNSLMNLYYKVGHAPLQGEYE
jgi:hypothetical protein